MDFGGFLLFGVLTLGMIGAGIAVGILFLRGSATRWRGLLAWLATGLLWLGLGRHLYQVYGLDEPLFIAAAAGDEARVRALLSEGASPDATWEDGTTALRAARESGHDRVVAILEQAGAR